MNHENQPEAAHASVLWAQGWRGFNRNVFRCGEHERVPVKTWGNTWSKEFDTEANFHYKTGRGSDNGLYKAALPWRLPWITLARFTVPYITRTFYFQGHLPVPDPQRQAWTIRHPGDRGAAFVPAPGWQAVGSAHHCAPATPSHVILMDGGAVWGRSKFQKSTVDKHGVVRRFVMKESLLRNYWSSISAGGKLLKVNGLTEIWLDCILTISLVKGNLV